MSQETAVDCFQDVLDRVTLSLLDLLLSKTMRLLIGLLACTMLYACASSSQHEERIAAQRAIDAEAARALVAQAPAGDDLPAWLKAERTRIQVARTEATQRFADAEKNCWRRFAVNDCLREASDERRLQLDRLRQEDLALNDLERKRGAAKRLRDLEKKQGG